MRLFLNIVLVLVTFGACYVEDIYLSIRPPKPGKKIYGTIRAMNPFTFDQEKELGGKRKIALSEYVPLYTHVADSFASSSQKTKQVVDKFTGFQKFKKSGRDKFIAYLKTAFGVEIRPDEAARILKYRNLENLLQGILTVEESILKNKIVADSEPFLGKKTIEVLYPEPAGTVVVPADEIITLQQARIDLKETVTQLFWQVEQQVLEPLIRVMQSTLQPNLIYDQTENDRRIENIIRRYPSKVIAYKAGDVLVPFRKILNEEDVIRLNAYQESEKRSVYSGIPWMAFVIVFAVAIYNLLLSRIIAGGRRKKPPYPLLLSLLIITVVLLKICLLLTPFHFFGLPFGVLPLLSILLIRERVSAVWTTITGALLIALFCGQTLEIVLFFVFGGLGALLVKFKIRKRAHILIPSLVVGLINMATVLAYSMDLGIGALFSRDMPNAGSIFLGHVLGAGALTDMAKAFAGGLATGPLALVLLPLLEVSWRTASAFKLNRYIDLQHPLMRDLLTKAPGTYQHTMSVAYLAQAAGEAIGANTLLLRIGAYYHDVGKMLKPKFFTENQFDGKNSHDDLTPWDSSRRIINHTKEGIKIAQEAGLPEAVVDMIPQHHGTQLVEYFYNKAVKLNPESEVRDEDYRYPGPKPQSVEAAILMIVDAVEAASRSIQAPTRENVENMIHMIIQKRIADGQFDECDLSTRDIAKIVKALMEALEATYHSRVEYPWQEEEKKAREKEILEAKAQPKKFSP